MDASRDAKPTAGTKPEMVGRLRSIAKIVILDVAAPLIAYNLLRSAGMSTVTALVLSGVFPALGVAIGVIQHHRAPSLVRIRLDFFEIDEDLIAVASASNPSIQEPEGRRSVLLADLGEQSLRKPG